MKKAGIVLIVIQVIAVISGLATHKSPLIDLFTSNEAGVALIAKCLGYFLPGIIGIILVNKGNKHERNVASGASAYAPTSASTASSSSAAPAGRNFCPKCGSRIEPDDAFCVNCGAKLR